MQHKLPRPKNWLLMRHMRKANISLKVSGRWGSSYRLSYGFWSRDEPTALEHFSPGENEVFGTDPSNLSREFEVSLSFNIE